MRAFSNIFGGPARCLPASSWLDVLRPRPYPPFPDLSDSGVNTGPGPNRHRRWGFFDVTSLDTYTSVSDAAGRADMADSMPNPRCGSTDTLRPRYRQTKYASLPSSQPFFTRKHMTVGLEIPADWCPAHSRPFANNFFTEPVNEPSCTECSCIHRGRLWHCAAMLRIDTQPTDYTEPKILARRLEIGLLFIQYARGRWKTHRLLYRGQHLLGAL